MILTKQFKYLLGISSFFYVLTLYGATFCSLSATPVSFGAYNPLNSTPITINGNVQVTCNGTDAPFTLNLSLSLHSGSYAIRYMAFTTNLLGYNLYLNPTYTTIWGDGTGISGNITGHTNTCKNVSPCNFPVFGRLPALQNVPPGSYSDTITATLIY